MFEEPPENPDKTWDCDFKPRTDSDCDRDEWLTASEFTDKDSVLKEKVIRQLQEFKLEIKWNNNFAEIQRFVLFVWIGMKLCESVLYQGYKSFDPVLFANCEKRLGKAAFGENQNLYI